ncbi:galactosyl transferase GMA12/MNN10 family-domain-containing protein [Paraphoma chrysanthemicola]|uniref:Galactosyl transferase GMA12/MNN10 family-domain-containing protein n=1 Tax=Paraphoma chrysanthemicola TaxID=798071 RepID=A0A8K0VRW3_9PLEO|nr:galactosyl transferase GMA12/MNN10 family-domain-containing protein [Paraphoma chrysanthemicola]
MLLRKLKLPPSLLLLIVFLAFFGWQLSQGTRHEDGPVGTNIIPSSGGEKKAPRIALMTFVTEQRSYLHLSLKNKDHYARRHGYDLILDYESHTDRAVVFWKFDMAERLIKTGKYDWIWWMDFDTLITNTDIKLTDIIDEELRNVTNPDEIDYLFTHDCNGFNAGSFLVRGHERSLKFIHDSWDIHDKARAKEENMSEQDSTVKLMKEDKASADRVHVVPQWKLNAFPTEIACFDDESTAWEHGQFVLHFAGAWAHVKGKDPTGQLMNKYEREIIWGDWKEFY